MNVDPVPRIDPGDMPRAGDWNKLADAYNQAGIHPEHREERGAGIRHRYDPLPEFLFARVWPAGRNRSPNGSCQMYRFRAVRSHGASGKKKCETTDTEPAFTGDGLNLYAIELDDRDAPPGSIQLLRKGAGNFYEFVASDAWPIHQINDPGVVASDGPIESRGIAGRALVKPRVTEVPVRMPIPRPDRPYGSIYEAQKDLTKRYFS